MEKRPAHEISRAVADEIFGRYKGKRVDGKRMTQATIAAESGIPAVTLRKKLAGESPITVHELVVIARAIGELPQDILEKAVARVATAVPVSEGAANNVTQMKKHPRDMTAEELDAYAGDIAAHSFDESADRPED